MEYKIKQEELNMLRKIFKFIEVSSIDAKALIVNEILMLTDIRIFDESKEYVGKVESICVDRNNLQLNIFQEE